MRRESRSNLIYENALGWLNSRIFRILAPAHVGWDSSRVWDFRTNPCMRKRKENVQMYMCVCVCMYVAFSFSLSLSLTVYVCENMYTLILTKFILNSCIRKACKDWMQIPLLARVRIKSSGTYHVPNPFNICSLFLCSFFLNDVSSLKSSIS